MELRHLRYFVAVAEALSFRRAAEQLRVAQPALSKQIKDLEFTIGTRLLERNTAGVALTDAGAVFLDEARDILERTEAAVMAARSAATGRSGRLTIGNVGSLTAGLLPPALSTFRTRFPNVDVNLREVGMPDQPAALKMGTIQVGFTLEDWVRIASPDMETTPMITVHLGLAMGSHHALARRSRISLAEVATEPFLYVGDGQRNDLHRQRTVAIFAARGIRTPPLKRVTSFESLVALVAGDHGLAILAPPQGVLRNDRLVLRPIEEAGNDLELKLIAVWRKGSGSQLARNFVEMLRTVARSIERRKAK